MCLLIIAVHQAVYERQCKRVDVVPGALQDDHRNQTQDGEKAPRQP